MSLQDEIEETKKKLRETPVNKSTETERARLKSKIARLKEKKEKKEKGTGASGQGYAVRKQGDATVALVGPPSAGKSTLLNGLTNADSEVADYEFTTLDVVPGMLDYRGAKIQILDVPGLIGGAAAGKGGGKEVLSVVRNSDLVLRLTDPDRIDLLYTMSEELYDAGIRLNTDPPDMKIVEKGEGGIEISAPSGLELEEETVRDVLAERGFLNCKVVIREKMDLDRFIDGVMDNRVYLPSLACLNKTDTLEDGEVDEILENNPGIVPISAQERINLDRLEEEIWNRVELMKIYTREGGKETDKEEPLVVDEGSTVKDIRENIRKKFSGTFRYAKVWGGSAKFPGQKVGEDHELEDEDIVELRF